MAGQLQRHFLVATAGSVFDQHGGWPRSRGFQWRWHRRRRPLLFLPLLSWVLANLPGGAQAWQQYSVGSWASDLAAAGHFLGYRDNSGHLLPADLLFWNTSPILT